MDLITILTSIGLSSLSAWAVVNYLGKRIIEHRLSKDLESYKQQLDQKTIVLKNELEIYAHEHTVKFNRLNEARADAIKKVFDSMNKIGLLIIEINSLCKSELEDVKEYSSDEERSRKDLEFCNNLLKMVNNLLHETTEQYHLIMQNQIYFDTSSYNKLLKLVGIEDSRSDTDSPSIYEVPAAVYKLKLIEQTTERLKAYDKDWQPSRE